MLRAAAEAPGTLCIGIDPVAAAMAKSSTRAHRARSGNAIFALGAIESLPEELSGLASFVTVNLPWGSLLRAGAAPDVDLLRKIAAICRPDARLDVVYSASARDATELGRLGLSEPDPSPRFAGMAAAYADGGFQLDDVRAIPAAALRELGTTWAKKLWRDPERRAWRLTSRRD